MKNRAKFLLWQSQKDWQWYWSLVSNNNEIIATSEGYKTEYGARKGIKAVRRIALFAKVDVKVNK